MKANQTYIEFPSDASCLSFTTNKHELSNWLHSFSSHLNAKVSDGSFEFPENFAKGYARVGTVENGLTYRLVNYTLHQNTEYNCEPSTEFNLIIYLYVVSSPDTIFFEVGDNKIESEGKAYRTVVVTNSRVKQKLCLKRGSEVKGLTIMLNEEWLNKKISNKKGYEVLKQNNFLQDVLNAKCQKIFGEIFNYEESSLPSLFITTRVLRLLECVLENILKRNTAEPLLSISSKDFESILKIEGLLLENYGEVFPKIEKLARLALMSESKLKKIYKQAFGMGLYEYYQKNRMHKAKELLNSGEYTVSQVGAMLGYQNLSNFSTSFKKEFNHLPRNFNQVD